MKADKLIQALKKKFVVSTDTDLLQALGLSPMTLHNWRKKSLTPRIIAELIHRLAKGNVSGASVAKELHTKLGTKSLAELARHFGVTLQAVQYWKGRSSFSHEEYSEDCCKCAQSLATYFSAYQIVDGMVNKLEALLVRSFANNLLNKRMETFGLQEAK
jgi:hypothetical protein